MTFQVVDLTQKPQDEVAIALHDCDNNVDTAIINLLEGKYNQVLQFPGMKITKGGVLYDNAQEINAGAFNLSDGNLGGVPPPSTFTNS